MGIYIIGTQATGRADRVSGLFPRSEVPEQHAMRQERAERSIRLLRRSAVFGKTIVRDRFCILSIRPALGCRRRGASLFIGRAIGDLALDFRRRSRSVCHGAEKANAVYVRRYGGLTV
jgi:hypothetical protein